ncbi:MAG: hypothetical protein AABY22_12710 [Nanoarchaeota archaeon]
MKIIRERSRTYKGKDYYKYKVNIPEVFLLNAEINVGDELDIEVEKHKLILKKLSKKKD